MKKFIDIRIGHVLTAIVAIVCTAWTFFAAWLGGTVLLLETLRALNFSLPSSGIVKLDHFVDTFLLALFSGIPAVMISYSVWRDFYGKKST